MNAYAKQRIALRYWLLGAGYHRAAEAMTFAEEHHSGLRKDGVTPEFAHQVGITHYLRTQVSTLRHPEDTLIVGLLHDTAEDYDVPIALIEQRWGRLAATGVDSMTKEHRGHRRNDEELFDMMAEHPLSSVAKPADRINNQNSMLGVFTPAKIEAYVDETRRLFLPMIKKAKRNFPDQEPAYEASKLVLQSQIALLEGLLEGCPHEH